MQLEDDDELSALNRQIYRARNDGNDYAIGMCMLRKMQLLMLRGEALEAIKCYRNALSRFWDAGLPGLLAETLMSQPQLHGGIPDGIMLVEIAVCRYLYCTDYLHEDAALREERSRLLDVTRNHVSSTSPEFAYVQFWLQMERPDGWAAIGNLCRTAARQAQARTSKWANLEHFLSYAYFCFSVASSDDSAREMKRMAQRADVSNSLSRHERNFIDFADRLRAARRDPTLENLDRLFLAGEREVSGLLVYMSCVAKLMDPRVYSSPDAQAQTARRIRDLYSPHHAGRPRPARRIKSRWRVRCLIAIWRLNRLRYAMRLPLADVELHIGLPSPAYDANEDCSTLAQLSKEANRTLARLIKRAQRLDYRYETSIYTKFVDVLRNSLAEAQGQLT